MSDGRPRKLNGSSSSSVARGSRGGAIIDAAADDGIDEFAAVRSATLIVMDDAKPAKECVPGRVPSGLVVLGARPKLKKTWFAMQLQIAKTRGDKFMGVQTDSCRTLGLYLEDNDPRIRKRLEFFGYGAGRDVESLPHQMHITYDWPTGALGAEKLHRWLDQFPDTRLIVVDVLQRFRGPREKSASVYESDYATMGLLHGVAQRYDDLTVLVLHHVRKGAVEDPVEALNGSFGVAGAADAYMILRPGAQKNQVIAHVDGRDWESFEHEFVWEFRQGEGWTLVGTHDVELTATQQEIIRYARDDGGCITPTKLAAFRSISKPTAHEALQALVSKGAMRVYAGKYYPNGDGR